jgi:hypothetical protein
VSIFNGDVVKSDTAVPQGLQKCLQLAVQCLEDVPEIFKVPDLVHPSLFPLIYGRSRVLENGEVGLHDCVQRSGEGKVVLVPRTEELLLDDKGCDRSQHWTAEGDFPVAYSRNF